MAIYSLVTLVGDLPIANSDDVTKAFMAHIADFIAGGPTGQS